MCSRFWLRKRIKNANDKKILTAALTLGLLITTQAHASCLNPNADSRLRKYCVGETLKNRRVSLGDARVLDVLLKREGYERGLGLPTQVEHTVVYGYSSCKHDLL